MKIMVVGGTGFLGYYTILDALKKGHTCGSLSLDDCNLEGWYPKEVNVKYGDIFELTEDELVPYFEGYEGIVYSVGPDDRITPPAPSYDFFKERLVDHCTKVLRAAERAGVKRAVVYNSYFAYFNRMMPEVEFAKKHPYIRVRVEQAKLCIEQAKNMDVMILELPYIFGSMPERTPLWKDTFLDRFANGKKTIMFPGGGTTMIAVQHVGEAGVGALMYGEHGKRYPVGEENRPFDYFLDIMMVALTGKKRKISHPPRWLLGMVGSQMRKSELKHGHEAGLNMKYTMTEIMSRNLMMTEEDMKATRDALKMTTGGLEEAIVATAKACYRNNYFK